MYDLYFISYDEENADKNWNFLKSKFISAKRIHGVKGISNAHKKCAAMSFTKLFWTVDGDTVLNDSWDFNYTPTKWETNYVHLWHSRNPVNGLEYGYGAIKLWPTEKVLNHEGNWLDFTTSFKGIKIVPKVIATTEFNSSEYSTWKSAFRECIKLSVNIERNNADAESKKRLETWMTVKFDVPFSEICIRAATDAVEWYQTNKENLSVINDFDWLKKEFNSRYNMNE